MVKIDKELCKNCGIFDHVCSKFNMTYDEAATAHRYVEKTQKGKCTNKTEDIEKEVLCLELFSYLFF